MIYLDNNATTLLDPAVFAVIEPLLREPLGNPSSIHHLGQKAKGRLVEASAQCARFFGCKPDEIVFTSGATEALNFLIRSLPSGSHLITSTIEHAAVLEPIKASGVFATYLDPLDGKGSISPKQVEEAIKENTRMILLAGANSETGIKTDIESIAQIAKEHRIPFVVDGVALLGKDDFNMPEGVAAACFSGHKIHGPLGIGIAIVRKPFPAKPYLLGGFQQRGLRAGTENLPAIVGFAKALELIELHGPNALLHMQRLRDRFEAGLEEKLPNILIHGKNETRVVNTSNIAFQEIEGEVLLAHLDLAGLAASHGSACSAGALEPSRVLLSMGIPSKIVRSSLRFSLSRFTTEEEIDASIELIVRTVKKLEC